MRELLKTHIVQITTIFIFYCLIGVALFFSVEPENTLEFKTYVTISEKLPTVDFSNSHDVSILKIFRDQSEHIFPSDNDLALISKYLENPKRYKIESARNACCVSNWRKSNPK